MVDSKVKAVVDHLQTALSEVSAAMLSDDAADPNIQQILGTLQQGIVGVVHAIRQAKSQQMAQAHGGGGQGQQMSASPGGQGYGAPPVSQASMTAAGADATSTPPGGGDEMARVLGPSNRGIQ